MELYHLIIVLLALIAGFVGFGLILHRRKLTGLLADARVESERIVSAARAEADQLIKSAIEENRAKAKQQRRQFEVEAKKKRGEVQKIEEKTRAKETVLNQKTDALMQRERSLDDKESTLYTQEKKYQKKLKDLQDKIEETQVILQKTAEMSRDEARSALIASLEKQAKEEAAQKLAEIEEDMLTKAKLRARHIIALSVQRQASEYVGDATLTVVSLPNEDMKGRIIGREGRNIRAIEQTTGVDVIIDDTPEAVILSCFHPIRREIAKITIERLMEDGRIHPARIEETAEKVTQEFDQILKDHGEKAAIDIGVTNLHPDLLSYLGHLRFRSFGKQSVLAHCVETGQIAGILATEIGIQPRLAKRAGLLHDIGKAVGQEVEGHHAKIGAKLCARYGESEEIVQAIRHHHEDDLVESDVLTIVLHTANMISELRRGSRQENIQNYIQRLEEMESLVNQFEGVKKLLCYSGWSRHSSDGGP